MTELRDPVQGLLGYLHEIEIKEPTSVLIFQLPRETKQLSESYLQGVMGAAKRMLPKDRPVMFIGCDVNVYELAGTDAVMLKLKGII